MHTYQKTPMGWEVGYWLILGPPQPKWVWVRTFGNAGDAARFANYMNGGTGADFLDMEAD